MTYPGGQSDPQQPFGQPPGAPQHQQPFGQPPGAPQQHQQPYAPPAVPAGPYQPPVSGQPYAQPPVSGQPFAQPPVSGQPFAQPPVSGQPFAQPPTQSFTPPAGHPGQPAYGPPTGALPVPAPTGGEQRGGKWALVAGGALLLVVALVVGGYFTFQQVFVHTPTEVVEAYLDAATKDDPDPAELERYLCSEEAAKLKKELANSKSSSSGSSSTSTTVLDWHVTGESVSGKTATVFTEFTIKTSSGRTTTNNLNLTLVKEGRAWKICGYDD
ncbi:hypothetical protein [Dactylosporangium aurantiacum]|uniref:Rv0361 family membrane protein n=1 Tax=Dactylosporangium aurantiacum TaxID=35754 RepID=UPI000A4C09AD|nr:hypothetical protein [Dactylosporangium aurantiacum]